MRDERAVREQAFDDVAWIGREVRRQSTGTHDGRRDRSRRPPGDSPSALPAYGSGARLQVPMIENGLPREKCTAPESAHLADGAVGAFASRVRAVTCALGPAPQAVPSEWRNRSSSAAPSTAASNRERRLSLS